MELKELTNKTIELLNIESPEQISNSLMEIVINNKTEYFSDLKDLSIDWLQKIFQYYLADRKEKMQDYTPVSLAKLVGRLTQTNDEQVVYDLCAGSGALTIQKWNLNNSLSFICYEYDKTVIPFLLFNLAARNINAIVVNGDALQDETFAVYQLNKGEKYATVTITDRIPKKTVDSCISNPPYNMKWKIPPFAQLQPRFNDCELPPESNANFAFILTALDKINEKASFLLPCGVLNGGTKQEEEIRKYLIEKNLIEAVITCPNNMFESTGIATCIIVFNKRKSTTQIELVDMRNTCEVETREQKGQYGSTSHTNRTYKKTVNVFSDAQIEHAVKAIERHTNEKQYSICITPEDVRQRKYNISPSTYLEVEFEPQPHREYKEIIDNLNCVIKEKNGLKLTINESLAKAIGLYDVFQMFKQSEEAADSMNQILAFAGNKIEKEKFIFMSKKAGELKFENGSKDSVSTILLSILQIWKQHIMYLNNEENRYLLELRDALLPDLMTGKIKI